MLLAILPFLIGLAVLLALSAFFSGSETALFSLTPSQVHQLSTSRSRLGHVVARLLRDPESMLITLLIGNMLVNVVYFTICSVMVIRLESEGAGALALTLAAIAPLAVIVLLGEVTPKVLAFSYPRSFAGLTAVPLFLVHQGLRPVRRVLRAGIVRPLTRLAHPSDHDAGAVTTEELKELLAISERRGILAADETMMLQEIIGLAEVKIREIMIPRTEMIGFDISRPREHLHEVFRRTHLTKLPVYEGNLDNIVGLAYARRVFLEPDKPLAELLTPVRYVAELATVEQLLLDFRRNRRQIAVVVDEFGGTAGIISLEDVLEEIVGDLADAQSPAERSLVEQVAGNEFSVSGQLAIHDWTEAFGHDLDDERLTTVGGLVLKLLGRLPRAGDRVNFRNITFTVESMIGRRIDRLRLTLNESGATPPGGEATP